jgi:hypothetical protein
MPRSFSRLFPFRLSHRHSIYISRVSLVCYMPRPSHPPSSRQLYDLGKQDSSRRFSSFISPHSSVSLLPLRPKHCSQSSVLKSTQTTLFPWWKRPSSTPIQNNTKQLYILCTLYRGTQTWERPTICTVFPNNSFTSIYPRHVSNK